MRLSWQHGVSRARALYAPLFACLIIAGCSTSGRFAGPSWNLTGGKDAVPRPTQPIHPDARTAGLPAPDRVPPAYRGGRDPITGRAPGFGATPAGIDARPLPPITPQHSHPQTAPTSPQSPPAYRPPASGAAPGAALPSQHRTVDVRPGQSLASIAGEHRVSIAAVMQANGLRDPYVIPGQQLIIPR